MDERISEVEQLRQLEEQITEHAKAAREYLQQAALKSMAWQNLDDTLKLTEYAVHRLRAAIQTKTEYEWRSKWKV